MPSLLALNRYIMCTVEEGWAHFERSPAVWDWISSALRKFTLFSFLLWFRPVSLAEELGLLRHVLLYLSPVDVAEQRSDIRRAGKLTKIKTKFNWNSIVIVFLIFIFIELDCWRKSKPKEVDSNLCRQCVDHQHICTLFDTFSIFCCVIIQHALKVFYFAAISKGRYITDTKYT